MSSKSDFTIIAIDGGGTHTRGALFQHEEIKAVSKTGTTRIGAVGVGEACERTLNVIIDLCAQANVEHHEIDALVIGLAGVWLEEEKLRAAHLLKTLGRGFNFEFNDLIVTSDAEIALEGALDGEDGIITIVGTGSIGLGKIDGRLERCGGWGIELDDEGSGAWIGREALTAVVRALDGRGGPTTLVEMVGNLYPTINIDRPRTIVKAYNEGGFKYQMLTPSVMKCAEDGDKIALDIIQRSAKHLVELPQALKKHYKNRVPVILMGGIIDNNTLLAKLLIEEINNDPDLELKEPNGTALNGAYTMAKKLVDEMD
ncbi:BadF/BadG/BcrA/BcrD ATPase family protein [Candidatus Kapabacteria bacterium]|nr:BadF/BadG/BcrA/BcrD ATPase family protein [Candidatus Kapabacteria bacterium]